MSIEYVVPLEKAVVRMKRMLFEPFRLESWMTLGFAAFLVALPQMLWQWSSNGARFSFQSSGNDPLQALDEIRSILAEPFWLFAIAAVLVLLVAISTLFLWIGCRARFVFLDNVVRERAEIAEPWKRHARLGDSLFLWIVAYGVVALVVWSVWGLPFLFVVVSAVTSDFGPAFIPAFVLFIVSGIGLALATAYVRFFLENFVVPVMYRDGLTATRAWGRFLPLLRANLLRFVLCGLWVFVLAIVVVLSLLVAGCATCCCGFLLLAIPYVGSVVMLPIGATYRAFGPEFLAQFGPEWSVFEPPAPPVVPAATIAPEPPLPPPEPPAI